VRQQQDAATRVPAPRAVQLPGSRRQQQQDAATPAPAALAGRQLLDGQGEQLDPASAVNHHLRNLGPCQQWATPPWQHPVQNLPSFV
jgi:hypothetical protein